MSLEAHACVKIEATPADLAEYFFNKDGHGMSDHEIADFFNHLGELVFSWKRPKNEPMASLDFWFISAILDLTPRGKDFILALANYITYDEKRFPHGKHGDIVEDKEGRTIRYREHIPVR